MKKVFLSLATIAFVAAGSLTVTSCGGDDSTPPVVTPELTENFVKFEGKQISLGASEYTQDTNGDADYVYSFEDTEGYFVYYTTYFFTADIENATALEDVEIFGQIGYFVQLTDVELNDAGQIIDYVKPLPNQASELIYDMAGVVNYGEQIGTSISALNLNVNSLVISESSVTTDFDGTITYDTGDVKFDYTGDSGFFANPISDAKGINSLKMKMNNIVKGSDFKSLKENASVQLVKRK